MNKKLRVFEAFAGIGAQASALKRVCINFEIVGISEWFIDALNCYDALHNENISINKPSVEEIEKELTSHTFSRDSSNPIPDIRKLGHNQMENLYYSHKKSKNYGSITEIDPATMPESDLLIYSFPCQDLSTGGKTEGMEEGSGTRSSLLWEIKRILLGLKKRNILPKYLLMENVKAIFAKSNSKALNSWLSFLEEIGYQNSENMILNSLDFGVPQSRKRAFILSSLGKRVDVTTLINYKSDKKINIKDFIFFEPNEEDYEDDVLRFEANQAQLNSTISRKEMWEINKRLVINNETIINTITCNMDRSNTAAMFRYNGPKGPTWRLLTIREAFLLMGFTQEEYERTKQLNLSYRKMNRLIGNSIVVNVLEEVFKVIYKDFCEE